MAPATGGAVSQAREVRKLAGALVLSVIVGVAITSPVLAQRRSPIARATLDVIGPRSTASVRAALRTHHHELAGCARDEDATVRVALSIAPDGSVITAQPIDDPSLDRDATACVVDLVRAWRFPRRATSVTTVSWSLVLRAPEARTCFCFHWVHGGDHGRTCEPTRAECVTERERTGRDSTECEPRQVVACDREAFIDGNHYRAD